jgi:coproporphyrinogen III oxidase-like Fe-S oxidoreductase
MRLGVGVSAAGYENGVRSKNTESVADYIQLVEEGLTPVVERVILDEGEKIGEDLMLSLRLKEGAEVSPLAQRMYGKAIEKYWSLGFLKSVGDGKRIYPTREGWLLSNRIFVELLSPQT